MNPQETSLLATMAVRIIYSAIILAAGIWAGKLLAHLVESSLERRKADPALAGFRREAGQTGPASALLSRPP